MQGCVFPPRKRHEVWAGHDSPPSSKVVGCLAHTRVNAVRCLLVQVAVCLVNTPPPPGSCGFLPRNGQSNNTKNKNYQPPSDGLPSKPSPGGTTSSTTPCPRSPCARRSVAWLFRNAASLGCSGPYSLSHVFSARLWVSSHQAFALGGRSGRGVGRY